MKFFRQTRKHSFSKKNVLNYIGYAIGEIVLVVLGILIAVSINNRNEVKQNKRELLNIYSIVKENLQNDLQEIDKVLNHYQQQKRQFNLVLEDSLTKKDYQNDRKLMLLMLGYPEISFDTRGYTLLSDYNNGTQDLKDTLLINVIDFYTERLLEIKVDDAFRARDFEENYKHWKKNYDWWADYIYKKGSNKFIDYALSSSDYKNRVATTYFLTYDVYLPELKIFKKRALDIITSIENHENQ